MKGSYYEGRDIAQELRDATWHLFGEDSKLCIRAAAEIEDLRDKIRILENLYGLKEIT